MAYLPVICIVALLAVVPALAQEGIQIEAGVLGGIPLNRSLQQSFCCTTASAFVHYEPSAAAYVTGLSGGAVLNDWLHVAFGAMYMPVVYRGFGTTCCPISHPSSSHSGAAWEFPLLADYRWLSGSIRPFSGGGIMIYNSTTGGENQSPAPVVSAGFEWLRGSFVVRPEFRYIRYRESFGSSVDVGRPANQTQLVIGIFYRR
jgi:hypothetical protein